MAENDISFFDRLRQVIRYEPETGKLFWLERDRSLFSTDMAHRLWNARWAGFEAFTNKDRGYGKGTLFGKTVYAHRICWALIHDSWPDQIDHINGNRSDNRIVNLRSVDGITNSRNAAKGSRNTSGVTGVSFDSRRGAWAAEIGSLGKRQKRIGYFLEKQDAIKARKAAEIALGYHPNHGR